MQVDPAPIDRVLLPFQRFLRAETAGGLILLAATAIALVWANSPWAAHYDALWNTPISVGAGGFKIDKPLLLWINDGLMAVFFLLVGLEIKREILVGELSSVRRALLPAAAAVGGMAGPALIYVAFNAGTDDVSAWGTPMATDIAFAVGVLALLGKRVPLGLKVFLVALAIVDDLGAVAVVALVYTEKLALLPLGLAAAVLVVLALMNALGVRRIGPYVAIGVVLWVLILKSGVHATVAGVLLAVTIPARIRLTGGRFQALLQQTAARLRAEDPDASIFASEPRQVAIHDLEQACELAQAPLLRLEHGLLPWVSFVIMPLFALANAGVGIGSGAIDALTSRIGMGIAIGLFAGNQIGITTVTWLVVKAGICRLPAGVTMRHVYGASCLAGIGFTMALFIAALAFDDPQRLETAKVAIMAGSLASGLLGVIVLRAVCRPAAGLPSSPDPRGEIA